MQDLTLSEENPRLVNCIIDASINGGNSGGPVVNEDTGKVVGVVYAGIDDAQGRNFIISMPVVRMFLAAYDLDGRLDFGLLPELGLETEELINSSQRRKYLGDAAAASHRHGVLVSSVDKFSCAGAGAGPGEGLVRVGDVLMAIDGHAISEKGEVLFRGLEYLPFEYCVTSKLCGERVNLTILRPLPVPLPVSVSVSVVEGEEVNITPATVVVAAAAAAAVAATSTELVEISVDLTLSPLKVMHPRILGVDYLPKWVIIGGLVFVVYGSPLDCEMYDFDQVRQREDEETVVLVDVLAHDINVTYDRLLDTHRDSTDTIHRHGSLPYQSNNF